MPHRRPGWALPNGHIVRSQSEAALCDLLAGSGFAHEHWAISFDVPVTSSQWRLFIPAIRLTDTRLDDRAVLIEPINSLQIGGGLRQLSAFRRRFGREYFAIVVTRRALHHRITPDSYDALFDLETLDVLTVYLRQPSR